MLPGGVAFLQPEEAVLEGMLEGWVAQQRSRLLTASTIENRVFTVRRFVAFTNEYPWSWTPADVEEWTSSLVADGLAHSTIRGYQMSVGLFVGYVCDARYGWADVCEQRFGTHPSQVFHEWNTAVHRNDSEARPERRPLSRDELQAFFDHADDQVARVTGTGRKGWLAAYRDAVLFKTMYAWGLRRRETAMLDVADWGPNAKAPQFGRFGVLNVRYGKASRGSPPRQRTVLTVMGWAAEAVAEWVVEIRTAYDPGRQECCGRPSGAAGWRQAPSTPASPPTATPSAWSRRCRRTVCGTRSSPISSKTASTSCSCNNRSGTAGARRPPATPRWEATTCRRPWPGRCNRRGSPPTPTLAGTTEREDAMKAKLGYRWNLRLLMAQQGMFATSDLVPLLAERGVELSATQVYRLVTQTPERLSLRTLMALCDILDCTPNDLIEAVAEPRRKRTATATTGAASVSLLKSRRPKRAEISER
jgi:DNA-binding Xre family transcriptional regulator